ncbi:MAG: DUF5686 and carboxypeptidase regulatory-like domain-containing protein [Prevotellaceae bacterium]|nr:DUF5686 and carboxypeptidase regulatory-like domain-containing protein [Prevotellaceae bacterium]
MTSYFAYCQDIIVIGQVFSSEDGSAIEGVNVWFSGTDIGTTTNAEGYFFLQSPQSEKSVIASFLGFKRREVRLDKSKRDQMIEIVLKRELNWLNQIVVTPPKADINWILKNFNKNRNRNNPQNLSGFAIDNHSITKLYLSNIQKKWLQKRIFSELQSGVLTETDSNLILPVHFSSDLNRGKYLGEKVDIEQLSTQKNTVEFLGKEQLPLILDTYISDVNFYENNIRLFGKSFVSPTSKYGSMFYDYYVSDTLSIASEKVFEIKFRPKSPKNLTFNGKMWIDAKNFALNKIEVSLPSMANLNFVNMLYFQQDFAKIDSTKYFYSSKNQNVSFNYSFAFNKDLNYLSAILSKMSDYSNFQLLDDSIQIKQTENQWSLSSENQRFYSAIDSVNRTKIQKVAYTLVDILMNGYIHAGKVDFGVIWDFFRFNALEGFRPTLSMRTSEKLNHNFTLGGYLGYGFKDKKIKYGGNFQYVMGRYRNHVLGIFYNNEVYRTGYGDAYLLNENMLGSPENLLTSPSWGQQYDFLLQQQNASVRYSIEKKGFSFVFKPEIAKFFQNQIIEFRQGRKSFSNINLASATALFRLSFKEKTLKSFFRNYYISSQYPILTFQVQGGGYNIENELNPYLKLNFSLKQNLSFLLGKFHYSIQAAKIFGKVPYFMLCTPLTIQGFWYNSYNFNLVDQSEFFADFYLATTLRYYSNGLIFNNIPYINRLNLRETVFVNVAWGDLTQNHKSILNIPVTNSLSTPYVEAGVGITNILRILCVESVWRLSHRHQNTINWGVRVKFYLDF